MLETQTAPAPSAVRDRPRTLDEAKAFLAERVATRRNPFEHTDQQAAREAVERLDGLDGERWAGPERSLPEGGPGVRDHRHARGWPVAAAGFGARCRAAVHAGVRVVARPLGRGRPPPRDRRALVWRLLATKLAHTHRQYLRGAVSWGGGAHYMYQRDWAEQSRYADSYLMELPETRGRMLGVSTFEDYVAAFSKLSLLEQGLLDRPCAPMLLVNGKEDTQCPIRDLYILLEHGQPKQARVFPGGHMGMTPQTWPTVIGWVQARLSA